MFKAILSTTVLPIDGIYSVATLSGDAREQVLNSLTDVPHYVGHPDTKAIAEGLGAVVAPTKLFAGLKVGEEAICLPIKQDSRPERQRASPSIRPSRKSEPSTYG